MMRVSANRLELKTSQVRHCSQVESHLNTPPACPCNYGCEGVHAGHDIAPVQHNIKSECRDTKNELRNNP
jgi:hypothetical protein